MWNTWAYRIVALDVLIVEDSRVSQWAGPDPLHHKEEGKPLGHPQFCPLTTNSFHQGPKIDHGAEADVAQVTSGHIAQYWPPSIKQRWTIDKISCCGFLSSGHRELFLRPATPESVDCSPVAGVLGRRQTQLTCLARSLVVPHVPIFITKQHSHCVSKYFPRDVSLNLVSRCLSNVHEITHGALSAVTVNKS